MTEMATLAAALAELQAQLPRIGKDKTAKVRTKTGGDYSYDYANLATVSRAVMPLLSGLGLCFTARPTLRDDGKFVLAYSLMHVSGDREDGAYPLPGSGTPQEIGSAITYARRYCLCAVTGVAPDEDDDDAAAAETAARKPRKARGEPLGPPPPPRPLAELPRNRDGSISRSQCTEEELEAIGMLRGERLAEHEALRDGADGKLTEDDAARKGACSPGNPCNEADCPYCTPDADLWTEPPARPPMRTPRAAQELPSQIATHFTRLDITDRDVRLGITAQIAGTGRLSSSKDLKASEALKVRDVLSKCRDGAALREYLDSNQEVTSGV
jgi:hypothetical protein